MLFRHALYQLSYGGIDDTCGTRTHILRLRAGTPDLLEEGAIATLTGLEPVTSCVTGKHSNQLNYRAMYIVTDTGIEPILHPCTS